MVVANLGNLVSIKDPFGRWQSRDEKQISGIPPGCGRSPLSVLAANAITFNVVASRAWLALGALCEYSSLTVCESLFKAHRIMYRSTLVLKCASLTLPPCVTGNDIIFNVVASGIF